MWWHRDYLGADNAGLHALLLRRTGQGEDEQRGAEIDSRTAKDLNVVKDLYGILPWVEKMNVRRKG
jgi:hypothetical protein